MEVKFADGFWASVNAIEDEGARREVMEAMAKFMAAAQMAETDEEMQEILSEIGMEAEPVEWLGVGKLEPEQTTPARAAKAEEGDE